MDVIKVPREKHGQWVAARRGKITASQLWRVMDYTTWYVLIDGSGEIVSRHTTKEIAEREREKKLKKINRIDIVPKVSPSQERQNYLIELVAERLTGQATEHYVTAAMQWGIDQEPYALMAYEAATGAMVDTEQHFYDAGYWGGTPDGLVGDDGMIEVKCPNTTTFIRERAFDEDIPQKYRFQMAGQLALTDRKWCDLVYFDPRLPAKNVWVRRYIRDPAVETVLTETIKSFNALIEDICAKWSQTEQRVYVGESLTEMLDHMEKESKQ